MAEFSKQYQEAFDFGTNYQDFDYEEIFETLSPNNYVMQICEGLGTVAVAKSDEGKMLLGIVPESHPDHIQWVSLEKAISLARNIQ
jgi:hypothetical protein